MQGGCTSQRNDVHRCMRCTPHKLYMVAGVGDMFAPKDASMQVEYRYQSVRVIAVYNTSDLPTVPGI